MHAYEAFPSRTHEVSQDYHYLETARTTIFELQTMPGFATFYDARTRQSLPSALPREISCRTLADWAEVVAQQAYTQPDTDKIQVSANLVTAGAADYYMTQQYIDRVRKSRNKISTTDDEVLKHVTKYNSYVRATVKQLPTIRFAEMVTHLTDTVFGLDLLQADRDPQTVSIKSFLTSTSLAIINRTYAYRKLAPQPPSARSRKQRASAGSYVAPPGAGISGRCAYRRSLGTNSSL